jgi:hypothetical protein
MHRIYVFYIILIRVTVSLEQRKPTNLSNDKKCYFCEVLTEALIVNISTQ